MATIVKCQVNQYCANTNTGKQCVAKTVYSEKKQIGSGTPKTPKTAQ